MYRQTQVYYGGMVDEEGDQTHDQHLRLASVISVHTDSGR
jgi:hypothetical protein